MAVLKVNVNFGEDFKGSLVGPRGTTEIGSQEGTLAPYDMLFGALASCLHSTFLDVATKKKLTFDRVEIEVTGEKRKEIPATLTWVKVHYHVYGASEEKGLEKSLQMAEKYCSIYETLSKVATMETTISFK